MSRLVGVFGTPAATSDDRLLALRALDAHAGRHALELHVAPSGEVTLAGGELAGDARPLAELLCRQGVRRLVIRRAASAREVAQLAGLLVRPAADDPPHHAAGRAPAAEHPLAGGLDALRIWSIQVELHDTSGDALALLAAPLRAAVEAALAATSARAVSQAYEQLAAALDRPPAADAPRDDDAVQAGRAFGYLLEQLETDGRRLGPHLVREHRASLERVLAPRLDAAVRGVVDGTVPEARRVIQLAAEQAVPRLLERLGSAATIDERRRCYNALLDAGGGTEALLAALRDERWYLVRNVALVLGERREAAAVRVLARCLQHVEHRVRVAAAQALELIDTPASMYALLGALRDDEVVVRRAAARALGRGPAQGVAVTLLPIANRLRVETDGVVIEDLVRALVAQGTPDAVGALAKLATGHADTPLGETARAVAHEALASVPRTRLHAALHLLAQSPDRVMRRAVRLVAGRLLGKREARHTPPASLALGVRAAAARTLVPT